jgi:putative Holliday junction resolvase
MGGVLAIDYGTLKCGFASTDALHIAREPLDVLRHEGREEVLLAHIATLLEERDVSTVLIGLPGGERAEKGPVVPRVLALVETLRERHPGIEVCTWDESLTTKEAEARLRALGRRGRQIRAERDSWSALVLLDDWLESH